MKKQSSQFCFAQYRFKIYPSFRCTGSLRPLGSLLSVEETSSRNLRKNTQGIYTTQKHKTTKSNFANIHVQFLLEQNNYFMQQMKSKYIAGTWNNVTRDAHKPHKISLISSSTADLIKSVSKDLYFFF